MISPPEESRVGQTQGQETEPSIQHPKRRRGPNKKKHRCLTIEELKFPPPDMDFEEVEAARISSGYYPPMEKLLEWFPHYRPLVQPAKTPRRRPKKIISTELNIEHKADVGPDAHQCPSFDWLPVPNKAMEPGYRNAVSTPRRRPPEGIAFRSALRLRRCRINLVANSAPGRPPTPLSERAGRALRRWSTKNFLASDTENQEASNKVSDKCVQEGRDDNSNGNKSNEYSENYLRDQGNTDEDSEEITVDGYEVNREEQDISSEENLIAIEVSPRKGKRDSGIDANTSRSGGMKRRRKTTPDVDKISPYDGPLSSSPTLAGSSSDEDN